MIASGVRSSAAPLRGESDDARIADRALAERTVSSSSGCAYGSPHAWQRVPASKRPWLLASRIHRLREGGREGGREGRCQPDGEARWRRTDARRARDGRAAGGVAISFRARVLNEEGRTPSTPGGRSSARRGTRTASGTRTPVDRRTRRRPTSRCGRAPRRGARRTRSRRLPSCARGRSERMAARRYVSSSALRPPFFGTLLAADSAGMTSKAATTDVTG